MLTENKTVTSQRLTAKPKSKLGVPNLECIVLWPLNAHLTEK